MLLPFAVVAEMLFGAEDKGWGFQRKLRLERFIRTHLIEYPNFGVCEAWAEVRSTARKLGRRIEPQDAWIAATALYFDLPLLTTPMTFAACRC